MDTDRKYLYTELTHEIIGSLYEVYNRMGFGYSEKIYQEALAEEFGKRGIEFQREQLSRVSYKNKALGYYFHDFLIEHKVILEVKVGDNFYKNHLRQTLSYLKSSGVRLGIVAVFTPKEVLIKRIVN